MIQMLLDKLGTEDSIMIPNADLMLSDSTFFIDGGDLFTINPPSWCFWINHYPLKRNLGCYIDPFGDVRVSIDQFKNEFAKDGCIIFRVQVNNEEDRNKIVDYLLNERNCLTEEEVDFVSTVYKLETL